MADAVEAFGQHVDQKPADELVRIERHRLVAAGSVDSVVLDLERHRLAIGRDQTPVRDRDTMGVALRTVMSAIMRPRRSLIRLSLIEGSCPEVGVWNPQSSGRDARLVIAYQSI